MSFSNKKEENIQQYGWKLKVLLLSRSQKQKVIYYTILFTQNSRQGKDSNRKQISHDQGPGEGTEENFWE